MTTGTTGPSDYHIEIAHVFKWPGSDTEHTQKLTAVMTGPVTGSISLSVQGKTFVERSGPNEGWINLPLEQARELGKWLCARADESQPRTPVARIRKAIRRRLGR